MLDTSLSMTGEKLALLAVAATVFAYKLPSKDIAIIAFESTANTIKAIRTQLSVQRIAQKILDVPAMGYTNIEGALSEGLSQLAIGAHKNRIGILISDGKYTAGNDPITVASQYNFLHVILTGDFNTDPATCAAMASAGHGHLYKAPNFQSLPRVLSRLMERAPDVVGQIQCLIIYLMSTWVAPSQPLASKTHMTNFKYHSAHFSCTFFRYARVAIFSALRLELFLHNPDCEITSFKYTKCNKI
jgi:hypothetical protein